MRTAVGTVVGHDPVEPGDEHERLAQPGELGDLLSPRVRGRDEVDQSGVVGGVAATAAAVNGSILAGSRAVDRLPPAAVQSVLKMIHYNLPIKCGNQICLQQWCSRVKRSFKIALIH